MNTFEVQLGYDVQPQRPERARFLPGDDPALWIREITRWNVPQAELELFVVPHSASELRPRGLIVRIPGETRIGPDWHGHAYGVIGGKLFVPVEAAIAPVISEDEWPTLLRSEYVAWVWHPQSGLVAFEKPERLRVADLIESPPEIGVDWGRAEPGEFLSTRIHTIDVERPPTVEAMFAAGQDDIGTQAEDLNDLPRSPEEGVGRSLGDYAAAGLSPFAHAARWLANHAPGGASEKTWVNSMGEWADEILKRGASIWNARQKELERLMSLLESDPDEGLKFALPVGGGRTAWNRSARQPTSPTTCRFQSVRWSGGAGRLLGRSAGPSIAVDRAVPGTCGARDSIGTISASGVHSCRVVE